MAAMLLAGRLSAAEDYFDYANVISAEPLLETVTGQSQRADCPGDLPATGVESPTSDPAGGRGIGSLLEALRQDLDVASCRERRPPVRRVVGYRVTYRYGDSEYVQVMDEDPGSTLRVQVRLEPGP